MVKLFSSKKETILFDCIQKGCMEDALISPQEVESLIIAKGINVSNNLKHTAQKKNTAKGIWNRNVVDDFQSAEIVERCIFMCLAYYRPDQWKQSGYEGGGYQSLMQTPYEERFSEKGIDNIYQTLKQWNMNSRGAKLQEKVLFKGSILSAKEIIDQLKRFSFLDFGNEIFVVEIKDIVEQLYKSLNITKNSRFVTVSKTLHFLHPQLMIPMDRTYTANYFHNYRFPDVPKENEKQAEWNILFHKELCKVYLLHKKLIDDISLETRYPITKLLDNLLIGFNMYRDRFINSFQPSFIRQ